MKESKIFVFGYFGYLNNQIDGQTIKTRNVYKLFKSNFQSVRYFDSQIFKQNKLKFFLLLKSILWSDKTIYLPAQNNLKYLFPLIFFLTKIFRIKLYYFVIGGWLCEFIDKHPLHSTLLKRIKSIYVETEKLKHILVNRGFSNVFVVPNFKEAPSLDQISKESKKSLVFVSRINKLKGYDVVFKLAREIKNQFNEDVLIDFYGPIFEGDRSDFLNKISKYDNTNYLGELNPQDIIQVISNYYLLLFPTKYYTEGLPGVIVDSFFGGLPVVASGWQYANEFIEDGVTGYISEWNNDQDFINKVVYLIKNEEARDEFQTNIRQKENKYTYDYAWKRIIKSGFIEDNSE
ncbi:glycosyltransferase family 4 protein [Sphingobacterium sp.]|uniref:glycosyltransferase family 4 protein n=1 Tax=Sphingobacterium sp. TaxID=341027 RepID=UPI0028B246A4|nr:glycosyltransferase family 4 protein [Sphingobacterium sp.]